MASKRQRRKQRQAAARKARATDMGKPRVRWDSQNGRWVNDKGQEVTAGGLPIDPATPLFNYNVACQCGEGKAIFQSYFRAANDEDLIDLVCKTFGQARESDFTVLDIHKTVGTGILVIRESREWPTNVSIIKRPGVTMRGKISTVTQPPAEKISSKSKKETVINKVIDEVFIPRQSRAVIAMSA